jgi:hypothetical protein
MAAIIFIVRPVNDGQRPCAAICRFIRATMIEPERKIWLDHENDFVSALLACDAL